jgi:nitroreductase
MKEFIMNRENREMTVIDTIYKRRAIRSYTKKHLENETINKLLDAAVHAPTAMHQESWAFAVIRDQDLLKKISDKAKKLLQQERKNQSSPFHGKSLDYFTDPKFNIFYGADALIVIYGKSDKPLINADCWLAAENLMLAACYLGLGSCVIGLAVEALNSLEIKKELNIPDDLTAFAPIILGYPSGETINSSRKKAEIIFKR